MHKNLEMLHPNFSHRLHIESGRWNRAQPTPRENRLCSICNVLEDEFHFLFECSLYKDEGSLLLNPIIYVDRACLK